MKKEKSGLDRNVRIPSVIFGLDEDTPDTFRQTVKFLIRNRLSIASINVLTPYPGTRVYERLKKEGRLLHENWEFYDHHTVVFEPRNMTPLELQLLKIKAKTDFNSIISIIRRLTGHLRMPGLYLASNLGYRKLALAENRRLKQHSLQIPARI